jgi:hypothetical protein
VTDGPFAETKEVLGGFIPIEARDMEEAIRIAENIPVGKFVSIEVRPEMKRPPAGSVPQSLRAQRLDHIHSRGAGSRHHGSDHRDGQQNKRGEYDGQGARCPDDIAFQGRLLRTPRLWELEL